MEELRRRFDLCACVCVCVCVMHTSVTMCGEQQNTTRNASDEGPDKENQKASQDPEDSDDSGPPSSVTSLIQIALD